MLGIGLIEVIILGVVGAAIVGGIIYFFVGSDKDGE